MATALLVLLMPPSSVAAQGVFDRSRWGLNVHWNNGQLRDGEADQVAQVASVVRTDARWGSVERVVGSYTFSDVETIVIPIVERNMTPMLIIDGSNPLYGPSGAPYSQMRNATARAAFVRFSIAIMEHFQGRGIVWELENGACVLDIFVPDSFPHVIFHRARSSELPARPNKTHVRVVRFACTRGHCGQSELICLP